MTPLDYRILAAVADLGEDARTLPLFRRVNGAPATAEDVTRFAVSLYALETRGWLTGRLDPLVPGPRPRLLWWLTGDGRRALEEAP